MTRTIINPIRHYRRGALAAAVAAAAIGIMAGIPAASSAGSCLANQCAWANINYEGGEYSSPFNTPSYTEVGGPYAGCTHTSFNDCASSILNNGPETVFYYENANYGGNRYENKAFTGASYVGEFWNDKFSSDIIG